MLRLLEMDAAYDTVSQKEQENYLDYYKESSTANKKLQEALSTIAYTERWKQILSGKALKPTDARM